MFNVVYINSKCVYYNKDFWLSNEPRIILNNFEENSITDLFNQKINVEQFEIQLIDLKFRLEQIKTIADQVQYNIDVGKEFIALFREEFVRTPLKEMTSLDIAQKTTNLIPLILTGSFREACDLLRLYEPDEFMTRERIDKYIAMLTSADAIDYNFEETNAEESTTVSETEEENVVENFTEELEEN